MVCGLEDCRRLDDRVGLEGLVGGVPRAGLPRGFRSGGWLLWIGNGWVPAGKARPTAEGEGGFGSLVLGWRIRGAGEQE